MFETFVSFFFTLTALGIPVILNTTLEAHFFIRHSCCEWSRTQPLLSCDM